MVYEKDGVKLYYEETGEGEPVLLLHGNGEDHTIFDVLAKQLADSGFHVWAPDSRGHGQSSAAEHLDYSRMAEDMAGLIRERIGRPVCLYGFSDGGILGLLLALRYPELLTKLVISGANLYPGGLKRSVLLGMKFSWFLHRDPKVKMMLTQPQIKAEELKMISVPTLVLAGSRDMIRESHTREIAEHIPGARLQILPGESHGSYVIHSDKLFGIMREFLREER
ncbi:alpha/beta hydrolase [Anaerolentibacter hominis]|uniref:alpha/beta fold hydrolase n=1 Tax=Anaerolentibacter hominis TaxID=3079009 RepID=UPI0031B88264